MLWSNEKEVVSCLDRRTGVVSQRCHSLQIKGSWWNLGMRKTHITPIDNFIPMVMPWLSPIILDNYHNCILFLSPQTFVLHLFCLLVYLSVLFYFSVWLISFHLSHNLFFLPKTPYTSIQHGQSFFCPFPGADSAFCTIFFCVHFTLG